MCDLISLSEVNLGSLCFPTGRPQPQPLGWDASAGAKTPTVEVCNSGEEPLVNSLTCFRIFYLVCNCSNRKRLCSFQVFLTRCSRKRIHCAWKRLKKLHWQENENNHNHCIPAFSLYRQLDIFTGTAVAHPSQIFAFQYTESAYEGIALESA